MSGYYNSLSCLDGIAEPCWEFLQRLVGSKQDYLQDRHEFEQTVKFLDSVPLFRQQLPRSELPKVAQHLTRKLWLPGQRLVRQGEVGRAFFLIQAGEALVVTCDDGSPENVRCVLVAGDYFGGHTLTTERPNVATITAGSADENLVTLSMSRKEFEALGLVRWLHFPKRPALYGELSNAMTTSIGSSLADLAALGQELPEEELAYIKQAIQRNANLRALLTISEDKLQELALSVARLECEADEVIGKAGSIGNEFFIVRRGKVSAVVDHTLRTGGAAGGGQQSAENAVAHSTMAERFLRKQHFLEEMAVCSTKKKGLNPKVTVSMFSPDGMPQDANASMDRKKKKQQTVVSLPSQAQNKPMLRQSSETPEATSARTELQGPSGGMSRQVSAGGDSQRRKQPHKMIERFRSRSNIDGGQQYPEPAVVPAEAATTETELEEGDSFGELSILYNMHLHATFKAATDATLYVIRRRHFTAAFNRKGRRFTEICKLLEEVALLAPLLSSERWELACSSTGFVDFQPGERVLHQGRIRETRRWYIIFSGSAHVYHTDEAPGSADQQLAALTRGAHFGERSLLRGDAAPPVSVDAGPEGMCCLTFHGEETKVILKKVMEENTANAVPSVYCDLKEWWARKAKGFTNEVGEGSSRSRGADHDSGCLIELTDLTKVCILGKGGYGQVCLVKDREGKKFALKVLSKGHIQEQGAERLVSWERELMSMVSSNFVVRLHRTFKDPQFIYFLLESALGGSLVSVMQHHSEVFSEDSPRGSSMAFYVGCITAALEHLHERRIVHRDLKPENVLLDEAGYAKVCDLGFARFVLSRTNTLAGTPDYMAPEMIDFPHTHGCAVDWWALGVLSYELMAGQTPFQDEGICDPVGRLLAIRRSQEIGILSYPFHFPYIVKPFVSRLLLKNPNERLGGAGGAQEVREQPFFKSVKLDFPCLHAQTLPSPYQKAWVDPESSADNDFRVGCDGFGLAPNDSIFMQYTATDNNWDAKF